MWCLRSASQKSSWAKLFLISEAAEVLTRYLGQTLVPRNKLQDGKTEDLTRGSHVFSHFHIIQCLFEGTLKLFVCCWRISPRGIAKYFASILSTTLCSGVNNVM